MRPWWFFCDRLMSRECAFCISQFVFQFWVSAQPWSFFSFLFCFSRQHRVVLFFAILERPRFFVLFFLACNTPRQRPSLFSNYQPTLSRKYAHHRMLVRRHRWRGRKGKQRTGLSSDWKHHLGVMTVLLLLLSSLSVFAGLALPVWWLFCLFILCSISCFLAMLVLLLCIFLLGVLCCFWVEMALDGCETRLEVADLVLISLLRGCRVDMLVRGKAALSGAVERVLTVPTLWILSVLFCIYCPLVLPFLPFLPPCPLCFICRGRHCSHICSLS